MTNLPQKFLTICLSATVCFSIFGCAETKLSQCQKIIEVTKNIEKEAENMKKTEDLKLVLQMTDNFEEAAEDMEKLNIIDEKLIEYKKGFAEVYRGNAGVTREFVEALQKKDITQARSKKEQLDRIGTTEKELVNNINSYCQGD